jgi:predicted transcriptional regulator
MPKIHLSMRIDQDVKLQLDDAAKKQNRTTANLIEWLFKQYLEQVAKRSTSKATEDDAWDKQIAADAEAGKLDFLLDAAQQDYDVGRLRFQ